MEDQCGVTAADVPGTLLNMSTILSELGRHTQALACAEEAAGLLKAQIENNDQQAELATKMSLLAVAQHNVGVEHEHCGNLSDALSAYAEGMYIAKHTGGSQSSIALRLKESHAAVKTLLAKSSGGGGSSSALSQTAGAIGNNLGTLYEKLGLVQGSVVALGKQARDWRDSTLGPGDGGGGLRAPWSRRSPSPLTGTLTGVGRSTSNGTASQKGSGGNRVTATEVGSGRPVSHLGATAGGERRQWRPHSAPLTRLSSSFFNLMSTLPHQPPGGAEKLQEILGQASSSAATIYRGGNGLPKVKVRARPHSAIDFLGGGRQLSQFGTASTNVANRSRTNAALAAVREGSSADTTESYTAALQMQDLEGGAPAGREGQVLPSAADPQTQVMPASRQRRVTGSRGMHPHTLAAYARREPSRSGGGGRGDTRASPPPAVSSVSNDTLAAAQTLGAKSTGQMKGPRTPREAVRLPEQGARLKVRPARPAARSSTQVAEQAAQSNDGENGAAPTVTRSSDVPSEAYRTDTKTELPKGSALERDANRVRPSTATAVMGARGAGDKGEERAGVLVSGPTAAMGPSATATMVSAKRVRAVSAGVHRQSTRVLGAGEDVLSDDDLEGDAAWLRPFLFRSAAGRGAEETSDGAAVKREGEGGGRPLRRVSASSRVRDGWTHSQSRSKGASPLPATGTSFNYTSGEDSD